MIPSVKKNCSQALSAEAKALAVKKELSKTRRFFGRNDLIEYFQQKFDFFRNELLEKNKYENPYILSYYGVGGIGKTRLLRELQNWLDAQKSSIHVRSEIDFQNGLWGVMRFMKSVRNQLCSRYHFRFPLYDLGLFVLNRKKGEYPEGMGKEGYSKFLDEHSVVAGILDATEDIPVIGIAHNLLKIADKSFKRLKKRVEKRKDYIKAIEEADVTQLTRILPMLFSIDVEDNMKDMDYPLVIFLDTYENLTMDNWLCGGEDEYKWDWNENALLSIPRVMWVVAGRNELPWGKNDAEWEPILDQRSITKLPLDAAKQFLKEYGVKDIPLMEHLYEISEGTPIYLNMCLDRFLTLTARGLEPTKEDFGADKNKLVKYYFRGLSESDRKVFYIVAALNNWDDEMFQYIAEGLNQKGLLSKEEIAAYEKVKQQSCVVSNTEEHFYYVHQLIGSVIVETKDYKMLDSDIEKLSTEYCENKLNSIGVQHEKFPFYVEWLVSQALKMAANRMECSEFYKEHVRKYFGILLDSAMFDVWQNAIAPLKKVSDKEDDYLQLQVNLSYLTFFQKNDLTSQALAILKKNAEIAERLYGTYGDKTWTHFYAYAKAAKKAYNSDSDELASICQKAKGKFGYAAMQKNDVFANGGENKVLWNVREIVDKDESANLFDSLIQKITDEFGEFDSRLVELRWIRNYEIHDYEQALEYAKSVFELCKKVYGVNHVRTLGAMEHIARNYGYLGRKAERDAINEETLEICEKSYGKASTQYLEVLWNACCMFDLFDEAAELVKYYEMYIPLLDEVEKTTFSKRKAQALICLASPYANVLHENEKARNVYQSIFDMLENAVGNDEFKIEDLRRTTLSAAKSEESDLENFDEKQHERNERTLQLLDRLAIWNSQKNGAHHQQTIGIYSDKLDFCARKQLGKDTLERVLAQCEQQFGMVERSLGTAHNTTLSWMKSMSNIYARIGQTDKSFEYLEKVFYAYVESYGMGHESTTAALDDLIQKYARANNAEKYAYFSTLKNHYNYLRSLNYLNKVMKQETQTISMLKDMFTTINKDDENLVAMKNSITAFKEFYEEMT